MSISGLALPPWRRAWALCRLLVAKAIDDGISLKASALAFVTIISFIPLLAAFSFVGVRLVDENETRIVSALAPVLPYTEEAILDQIEVWTAEAESLRGLGALGFLVVALSAFATIEHTINQIWEVGSRSLRSKILGFTLLIFWGPLVIGLSYSVFIFVRTRSRLPLLDEGITAQIVPFLLTLVGLTMLYWQVPHTFVSFRNAFRGGFAAALLLEVLRRGFAYWIVSFPIWQFKVYGSIATVFLFLVSVQLAWLVTLIGCEIAYVSQHADALLLGRRQRGRAAPQTVGLAVLVELARRLHRGTPTHSIEELGLALGLGPGDIRSACSPLVRKGILVPVGRDDVWTLGRDPGRLTVGAALSTYDDEARRVIAELPAPVGPVVGGIAERVAEVRPADLVGLTVSELADLEVDEEEQSSTGEEGMIELPLATDRVE